jgi:hypothetical protein
MPNAAFLKPLGVTLVVGSLLAVSGDLFWTGWLGDGTLHLLFAGATLMTMGFAASDHPRLSAGERQAPLALALGGGALPVILFAWLTQRAPVSVGAAFAYQAIVLLLAGRCQNRTS